jgi:hypothetical protein
VPLTASLYVPGTLKDADNVIVDVGTGFYVEKVRELQRPPVAYVTDEGYRVPKMRINSTMARWMS